MVKNVGLIGGVDKNDIVLVDDKGSNFVNQWEHGVPIVPFKDNYDDCELTKLLNYFKWLNEQKNFLKANSEYFKIGLLFDANNIFHAYDLLFG